MFDDANPPSAPSVLDAILTDTAALGFTMASTPRTGVMLCALAASKPGGRFLELGTGTGMGAAWLLHGMDAGATLDSVDNDPAAAAVAKRHLGHDPRVRFHLRDAAEFLRAAGDRTFDLIYADTWAGKFTDRDAALSLLGPGGLYVIDDLLPQPSWTAEHAAKVVALTRELSARDDLALWPIAWDTGIVIAAKKA